ncbi:MAG: SPOR domain-containing protein [Pseudomonadota bacterium]
MGGRQGPVTGQPMGEAPAYSSASATASATYVPPQYDDDFPQDAPFADAGSEEAPRGGAATLVHWAGGLASLALVIGLGFWGYKLVVRDASGVPVVAAMDGPMRIEPAQPGGTSADNQGLAVNEIAANFEASEPGDVALAPSTEGLSVADALPETAATAPVTPLPVSEAPETQDIANLAPATEAALQELVDELARQSTGRLTVPLTETTVEQTQIVPGGLGQSLRPRVRPQALVTLAAVPVTQTALSAPRPAPVIEAVSAALPQEARDVPASDVPAGTRLVQLGAYETPEIAKLEWDKISARFDGYLISKARVIEKAASGGKTFYRLRAMGFDDLSDARRFCAALVSENAACIPVVTR